MVNTDQVAPSATQTGYLPAANHESPFKEDFTKDPCLVSVCLGGINNTWLTYPFTPLEAVAEFIRNPIYLGKITAEIRAAVEAGDKELKDHLKSSLAYMMYPALAERRRTELIFRPNSLFCLDIDHLDSLKSAEALKQELFNDEHLDARLAFISPSGRGVKVLIRRPLIPHLSIVEAQKEGQNCINEYFNSTYGSRYGVMADAASIDLVRTCYLCHDAGVLFRG